MSQPSPPFGYVDRNSKSLRTLARAIEFSQGQFSLILARCDYASVRSQMIQELQTLSSIPIRTLTLPDSSSTLFTKIQTAIAAPSLRTSLHPDVLGEPPQALMVLGLESVTAIDTVLTSTNQVREEFRKNCPFPLVLWVDERVLQKLLRLAPDFKAWAGTSIQFEMAIAELKRSLQEHADHLFADVLDSGDETLIAANWWRWRTNRLRRSELNFALQDIFRSGDALEPRFRASLDFLLGRDAHSKGELEAAREYYTSSLSFWQEESQRQQDAPNLAAFIFHPSALERQACVLFHLGLCWRAYAVLQRTTYAIACQQAGDYFEQSLKIFESENRQDLVAKFVTALEEIMQKLGRWEELEALAKNAVVLHQLYVDPVRQARDHGFLAEVALVKEEWQVAKSQAEMALRILETTEETVAATNPPNPNLELSLDVAKRFHRGWYLLVLARAEARLDQTARAVFHLEEALLQAFPQDDPQLYSQILQALQQLYFQQANYLEAFRTKQTQRGIEHQYGFRAFVGALRLQPPQILTGSPAIAPPQQGTESVLSQEITASGRQRDVKQLIDRMGRNDYKLTVIHGPSGVGKSSIVTAGFVPALKDRVIRDRIALPLVVDIYTDWLTMLDRHLKPFQETLPLDVEGQVDPSQMLFPAPESILQKLSKVTAQGLLPVLIFDQFEEFFFAYETLQQRRFFYDFLCACLNLPFVKIVLSIREDYLHYLLEIQRTQSLDIINNDILSKDIRYPLGDLLPEDAKSVIKNLTNQAQFYLEDDLVDELVRDLAGDLGEVRPIELQVVGAELQAEDIRTLQDYRRLGPKEKLVERSLESVIKDCGPENEKTARLVLFLLTNPNGTRPLKTRDELVADFMALQLTDDIENLDLVLEVLAGSGLVFLVPETPAERYQLVHDYLVSFIRQQQESDVMGLKLELDQERLHRKLAEERQKASEEKLSEVLKKQLELARAKVFQLTVFGIALGAMAIVAMWAATEAVIRTQDAEEAKYAAEIQAKELQVINKELQVTRNRANRAETEVQVIRGLMSATQPLLDALKPPSERSPTPTPLSTPSATPTSTPPTSTPSPSPTLSGTSLGIPSPTMTQDEAVALVKQWLAAKHNIFAPPYDQQLAATLTTGPLYADLTRAGGSIDWLRKSNSFYRYGAQTIDAILQFTIEGTVPTLELQVTEDSTLYLRNRRARTTQKPDRFRYRFEFVGDRWKILDYTTLP